MTSPTRNAPTGDTVRSLLNKVPEVTLWFWIVKILCTTVGETFADYLSFDLNIGMANTTILMSALLAAVLVAQFRSRRHVPTIYWLAVVLVSIVGTLITDNLVDNLGLSLMACTIGFSVALAGTFYAWYRSEGTLSIHAIVTAKREVFYWLAILFTFALGTATGDLVAERAGLGYLPTGLIVAASIAAIYVAHRARFVASIPAFWAAYILTRPLGASIGDFLSQARADGGLGLGTTATSFVFLAAIAAVVVAFNRRQPGPAALHRSS